MKSPQPQAQEEAKRDRHQLQTDHWKLMVSNICDNIYTRNSILVHLSSHLKLKSFESS